MMTLSRFLIDGLRQSPGRYLTSDVQGIGSAPVSTYEGWGHLISWIRQEKLPPINRQPTSSQYFYILLPSLSPRGSHISSNRKVVFEQGTNDDEVRKHP